MRTLKQSLKAIAKKSAAAKFSNHMDGSMLPRGLNFWAISQTLSVVYPEATYDNTLEEFVELEDYYFDKKREDYIKAYEKKHGKA
jgi:hypothetical protein